MNFRYLITRIAAGLLLALALSPQSTRACAVCYGASDAPMAQGMNWGILSLLAVVVVVLGGITGFAIYLAKRAASMAHEQPVDII